MVSHCPSIDDYSIDVLPYQSILWDIIIIPSVGNDEDLRLASLLKSKRNIGLIIDDNNNIVYDKDSVEFLKIRNDRNFRANLGISSEKLCIAKLGLESNTTFYDYKIMPREIVFAKNELDKITSSYKEDVIGIHFGSSYRWDSKKLPLNFIVSLLSGLVNRFPEHHIVIFVGPREEEFVVRNYNLLNKFDKVHFLQNYDPYEVVAIISLIGLVISTDSFIMHAAIAVRKKFIALFGPTSVSEIDFFELGIALTLGLDCSPCFAKQKHECINLVEMKCINEISISLIIEAVQEVYFKNT